MPMIAKIMEILAVYSRTINSDWLLKKIMVAERVLIISNKIKIITQYEHLLPFSSDKSTPSWEDCDGFSFLLHFLELTWVSSVFTDNA